MPSGRCGASHLQSDRNDRTASSVKDQIRGPTFPPIPAGASCKVEAFGKSRSARWIVGLVLEHEHVANAEVAANVLRAIEPRSLAIWKGVRPRRIEMTGRIEPQDLVLRDVQAPGLGQPAREPSAVRKAVGLVGVAVESVIDLVIDELLVPAPALEAARIRVLHPADFASPEVENLLLIVIADARP